MEAAGDISLADLVGADYGGVSVISEDGKIFTPGGLDDTLNVGIFGWSDNSVGSGADLPYGPGKAAIVIIGAEDLMLGPDAELMANGTYNIAGDVDDRPSIAFLDIPATFGGIPKDEGDPFDLAIYLASTEGDVGISSPVTIMSYGEVPKGTMVIDAYDTVIFGGDFEDSLANGEVGNRLEVVSRITEWLDDAISFARLPYASGGGPFPAGYDYVLRGAGLENLTITEPLYGGAWVLESRFPASPTAPLPVFEEPEIEGCPALMDAVAIELGITSETIQLSINGSLAESPTIQPCNACTRLINYAAILRDPDGSRMATLVQVFNTIAPVDVPFTPEMATSIATTFEGAAEGTQYASVMEYIDAFVQYAAVLDTDLGSPVGDSVAFVMGKYSTAITETDNSNIAAFISARMENL